jgi:TrmH family RNA methyltransferase
VLPSTPVWREIQSRDNPLVQRIRRLQAEPTAYRKMGQAWLEGEHLALALAARGARARCLVLASSAREAPHLARYADCVDEAVVLPDRLFETLSSLPSPTGIGLLLDWPGPGDVRPGLDSVVLQGLQDAGNVGSILRSAAAMGIRQVVALKGSAALWSPKVLRAGMGAHFGLHLVEQAGEQALDSLQVPLLATAADAPEALGRIHLPQPCAWLLGHEGQGVSQRLMACCALSVRIPQPGGEESLNVAAAAAICFYEAMRQRQA